MTALKLKNELLQLIIGIDDVESLMKLKETANSLSADSDGLNTIQIKALNKSIQDLDAGRLVINDTVLGNARKVVESRKTKFIKI